MAIIACAECGKKISSHAPICSHCGCQMGEVSEQQYAVFRARKLRDKIYHLNMTSYVVMTAFVAGFGWYWWDSGGFEQPSSAGPFMLMGLAAVAYLLVRVVLFLNRRRQKRLRQKELKRSRFRRKF